MGQGLPAAGRRGPHSSRPWESSLRNPEASGGLWPGFPCSWVLLHVHSPGNTTSHSRVHLPRVTWCRSACSGGGQGARNSRGQDWGVAGSRFPGMEGELTRGRTSTLHTALPHAVKQPPQPCASSSYSQVHPYPVLPPHPTANPSGRHLHHAQGVCMEHSPLCSSAGPWSCDLDTCPGLLPVCPNLGGGVT